MAIFNNSPAWTISTADLKAHLHSLESPDRLYWDARQLKLQGEKFQNLDWSFFPKPEKIDGVWKFAAKEPAAAAEPATTAMAPVVAIPAPAKVTGPVSVPAPTIDEELVIAQLEAIPGTVLCEWVMADCPHPAPAPILFAKQLLGCGWSQMQRVARREHRMSAPRSPVAARLQEAPACMFIDLNAAEQKIYRGAGPYLARFEGGELAELFAWGEKILFDHDTEKMIAAAICETRRWLHDREFDADAGTEIWFGICSGLDFCDPRPVSSLNANAMAFIARQIADDLMDQA